MPGMRAEDWEAWVHKLAVWPCFSHVISLDLSGTGKLFRGMDLQENLVHKRTGSSQGAVLAGLVPTDAHPGIGFARVILSEPGHSVSLVNIKADLQAPRLLQQPENRVRNFRDCPALPFFFVLFCFYTPPFPSPSSRKQPVWGNWGSCCEVPLEGRGRLSCLSQNPRDKPTLE